MGKIVRIGKVGNHDDFRRDDVRNISPRCRVNIVLKMQSQFFEWDINSRI
jgi:hypothetical protein